MVAQVALLAAGSVEDQPRVRVSGLELERKQTNNR